MADQIHESFEAQDVVATTHRKRLPAWALSAIVHLVLLISLGLVLRPVIKGVEGGSDREGGILVVKRTSSKVEFLSESDLSEVSEQSESTQESSESPSPFPQSSDNPAEQQGLFPTMDGSIGPVGSQTSAVPDASELLNGLGSGGQVGQDASTQVFGAQGTGSKFIYVFDRSSSMEGFGGRPRKAAQDELAASLGVLKSTHQFQIIFYNEDPSVFNPNPNRPPRLMFGTEDNLKDAQRFIQAIRGAGGTSHVEPLTLALNMGPDVIFFLTDAQEPSLTDSELDRIRQRNRSNASINTIEFGAGPQQNPNNFLAKLARQNGGQHVYVDVTKLP